MISSSFKSLCSSRQVSGPVYPGRFASRHAAAPLRRSSRGLLSSSASTRVACRSSAADVDFERRSQQGPLRPGLDRTIKVVQGVSNEQRMLIVNEIVQTRSYMEIKDLMMKWPKEMEGEVAAYTLLQAANLRSTSDPEVLQSLDATQTATILNAEEYVVTTLVPPIEQCILSYPASTQISIVSALSSLQHYNESIFSAVAQSCINLVDATGGMVAAVAAAAANSTDPLITEPPSLTPQPDFPPDLNGVIGLQLTMVCNAYSWAGHYDSEMMDLIARQAVQHMDSMEDVSFLVSILGTFMDMQHLDRELMVNAGNKLAINMSDMDAFGAATVLLVYAFFGVRNLRFYESLLEVAATMDPETMSPQAAGILYRGVHLLPEPQPIPPAVETLLVKALDQFGPLLLSVMSPSNVPSLEVLESLEESVGDPGAAQQLAENKLLEISVRGDLFLMLSSMEAPVLRNQVATEEGWLLAHIAQIPDASGERFAFQVLSQDKLCKNDSTRLRGQVQSELRCMQRAGWVVVPVPADDFLSEFVLASEAGEDPGQRIAVFMNKLLEKVSQDIEEAQL